MGARRTHIELFCETLGIVRRFEPRHAERLLKMKDNGGWRLPDNSAYEITSDGTVRRRHKEGGQ